MATEKTVEILEFKVDQGAAITELERTRKAMIALKEEQGELQKAYKKGDLTLEEYAKEITRVDLVQKRLSANHSDLQKKVTGTSSAFDKFTKSLQSSTQNLTIAGTNVGALGGAVTKLMTPVGLAIGAVGLLGAAYAKSAAGSKDLTFASNQLGAAIQIMSNNFANLLTSSEDGKGTFSTIVDTFLRQLTRLSGAGTKLADESKAMALVIEQMDDLSREQIRVQGEVKLRLGENADLLEDIADSHTSANDRAAKFLTIENNILTNYQEQKKVLQDQFDLLKSQEGKVKDADALQTLIVSKENELKALFADKEKALGRIGKQQSNIADATKKQAESEKFITSELERQARISSFERTRPEKEKADLEVKIETDAAQSMFEVRRQLAERTKKIDEQTLENFRNNQRAKEILRNNELDSIGFLSDSLGRAFTENTLAARRFAAVQILIDAGLTLASVIRNAASLGPIAGPIYLVGAGAAAAIALKRAAALAGVPFGGFGAVSGEIFTAANGKQYTVVNGKTVELNEKGKVPFFKRAFVDNFIGAITLRPVRKAISGNEFSEGGFTGHGDTYEPAGIVHRGEVVWNKKDVAAIGGPTIANMIRPTYKGYANGGIVTPSGGMLTAADVINIVSAMPPNALVYKEFRSFEKGVIMKEQSTTR